MRKWIASFLMLALLFSNAMMIPSRAANESGNRVKESFLNYTLSSEYKNLHKSENFAYIQINNQIHSDAGALYCMQMLELLTDNEYKYEPTKKNYTHVLLNLMAAYDYDNATLVKEQYTYDDLKTWDDYKKDIVGIGVGIWAPDEIEKAINTVTTITDSIEIATDAVADVLAITKDYSGFDGLLKVLEDNAADELKEAAKNLRNSLNQTYSIVMEEIGDASEEIYNKLSEEFFSDYMMDCLKLSTDAATDPEWADYIESLDEVVSDYTDLKDAWDLGVSIGKLAGDVAVGGENIMKRINEISALTNISNVINSEQITSAVEVATDMENIVGRVVDYSEVENFLVLARLRGEYCVYSILKSDSGLLSILGGMGKDAEEFYERQSGRLIAIRNTIQNVNQSNNPLGNMQSSEDIYAKLILAYQNVRKGEKVDESIFTRNYYDERSGYCAYDGLKGRYDISFINGYADYPEDLYSGYGFTDINKDGIDEIIFCENNSGDTSRIGAIWTWDGNSYKWVYDGDRDWPESLLKTGYIVMAYHRAFESLFLIKTIDAALNVEEYDSIRVDHYTDSSDNNNSYTKYYDKTGAEISKEDSLKILSKYYETKVQYGDGHYLINVSDQEISWEINSIDDFRPSDKIAESSMDSKQEKKDPYSDLLIAYQRARNGGAIDEKIFESDNDWGRKRYHGVGDLDPNAMCFERNKVYDSYMFKDLNSDGIVEMILGSEGNCKAIWTIVNGKYKLVYEVETNRSRLEFAVDGDIIDDYYTYDGSYCWEIVEMTNDLNIERVKEYWANLEDYFSEGRIDRLYIERAENGGRFQEGDILSDEFLNLLEKKLGMTVTLEEYIEDSHSPQEASNYQLIDDYVAP